MEKGRSGDLEYKTKARVEFEEAISVCWNELHRRAVKSIGKEEADDIVMATYAEVLARPNWEEITNPRSWMIGQLKYQILRFLRARFNAPKIVNPLSYLYELNEIAETDFVDPIETIEDFSTDLIDRMARDQETKAQIDSIMAMAEMARLSAKENYIFLARLRDVTYGDIGRTLGMDVNSVRDRYSKAIKKIRQIADQEQN